MGCNICYRGRSPATAVVGAGRVNLCKENETSL